MTRKRTLLIAIICAVALVLGAVSGAAAYMISSSSIANGFSQHTPTIIETFDPDHGVKKDVAVCNTDTSGDVLYIRARIDVSWQDRQGNQLWTRPVQGNDYTLTFKNLNGNIEEGTWIKGADGFYYWTLPVAQGERTDYLIDECSWTHALGENQLVVQISAQGATKEQVAALWNIRLVDQVVAEVEAQ